MTLKTVLLGATASLAFGQMALAERGSDGEVRVIYYQAPSIMNPYLSSGTKDEEASSVVLEPLIRFNPKGEMLPWLVTEIPTLENGGVSADMTSVTYTLKPGLKWSDGSPVTSEDVVFTYEYCTAEGGGCAQAANFEGIKTVEALDPSTIRITFTEPKPVPYTAFSGAQSPIIQKKQFANCMGDKAPTCTEQNFNPIGTGAFVVKEFRPNDVITFEANPYYRDASKPAFQKMTLKGGGDAAAAARSVLETGEFDYAWNTQLAPEVLEQMMKGGKGKLAFAFGSLVERIELNGTDPSPSLPADERATVSHPHPILSDIRVRQALSKAIDRSLLAEIGYGDAGKATCNLVPAPAVYADDTNTDCLTQDIEGAKALLEEAGWKVGPGGVREKDGQKLSLLFQTSTNAVRQDFQSVIKEWWTQIGVQTELKNVDGSVFFGSDPGSPDTFPKFYADVEMYANNFNGADPEAYLSERICSKIPSPATQWQGQNVTRFCSPEYDALAVELGKTGDIEKRGEIARRMNDMITRDTMNILPLVYRGTLSATANTLGGVDINAWDSQLWNVADWYRMK